MSLLSGEFYPVAIQCNALIKIIIKRIVGGVTDSATDLRNRGFSTPEFSHCHFGKLVFAQLMDFLPRHRSGVASRVTIDLSDQNLLPSLIRYLSMAAAAILTFRESLRDIEVCLHAHEPSFIISAFADTSLTAIWGDAKRETRLAHLSRFRERLDRASATALRRTMPSPLILDNSVYALATRQRLTFAQSVSVGADFAPHQSRREDAHARLICVVTFPRLSTFRRAKCTR